jgi:hypothetical protein
LTDNLTSKKKTIVPVGMMDASTEEFTLSADEAAKQKFLDENQKLQDIEQIKNQETKDLLDLLDKANALPELSDKMTNLTDDKDASQNNVTEVDTGDLTETIDTPITKFICQIINDHQCKFLTEKYDANWCKPNAMFGGVRCQGESCGKMFVHKIVNIDTEFRATNKRPMHVCMNERMQCTFAYCHDCYLKVMLNE